MKRTVAVMLATITLLIGATVTWELAYNNYAESAQEVAEVAHRVERACSQIAELTPTFPTVEVSRSQGEVHDAKRAVDHRGCRIEWHGRDVALIRGHWPHELVRERLLADNWVEDIGRAADGPASTAFSASKDSVACLFSASWTVSDKTNVEPVASEYRFEAGCFRPAQSS